MDYTIFNTLPIVNSKEVDRLTGLILTVVDATSSDPVQRKALKDIMKRTLFTWSGSLKDAAAHGYIESVVYPDNSDDHGGEPYYRAKKTFASDDYGKAETPDQVEFLSKEEVKSII